MPEGINHCGPLFLNQPIGIGMGLNADPRGTHKQLPVAIERSAGKAGQQSVIEQGSFFHQNGPSKNPTDLPKTAIL
jgi:hypothetical protein